MADTNDREALRDLIAAFVHARNRCRAQGNTMTEHMWDDAIALAREKLARLDASTPDDGNEHLVPNAEAERALRLLDDVLSMISWRVSPDKAGCHHIHDRQVRQMYDNIHEVVRIVRSLQEADQRIVREHGTPGPSLRDRFSSAMCDFVDDDLFTERMTVGDVLSLFDRVMQEGGETPDTRRTLREIVKWRDWWRRMALKHRMTPEERSAATCPHDSLSWSVLREYERRTREDAP